MSNLFEMLHQNMPKGHKSTLGTTHPLAMKEYFMKTQFEKLILNVICVAHRKTQHDKNLIVFTSKQNLKNLPSFFM